MIEQIKDIGIKRTIARNVLESLPDWFAVAESRENYITECAEWTFLAAKVDGSHVGFLCLKETGKDTVEIAVMGVLPGYHRKGIGKTLFEEARKIAMEEGYSFMQVKTVQMGVYEEYDRTNQFYLACGFKEFEVLKDYWDEKNPCQVYVMEMGLQQNPDTQAEQVSINETISERIR